MNATQEELGPDFYVFSTAENPKGWSARSSCIIDSHGRRAIAKPDFIVPVGVCIKFYSSHGASLNVNEKKDPGDFYYIDAVHMIASGLAAPRDTFPENRFCPNYVLSKMHEANNGKKARRYDDVGYDDIKAYLNNTPSVAAKHDIVTVRNRFINWVSGDITLYDFVRGSRSFGFAYPIIHCCFCRTEVGDMITGNKPPAESVHIQLPREI
jgi:hypothetical protein